MPDGLDTSVVICAYTEERWDALVAAIASVRQQSVPASEIIVVVDHNPRLLKQARSNIDGVTVVNNGERQGLSGARNAGVKAARGALIAFLDDDATAEPDWLKSLTCACEDVRVLGSGGLVEPAWHSRKPSWLPEEFYWVVGCSYEGLPTTRQAVRNPIGASMCIRRDVFDAIGGFRSGIGRFGKRPTGCEETDLCIRAQQHWPQGTFLYEPAARARHGVPPSRTNWRYFCSRCYSEGRSKASITRVVGARDGLASELAYTTQTLPKGVMRSVTQTLIHRDITGLARAGVIVAGLAITSIGYATGMCAQFVTKAHEPRRRLFSSSRLPVIDVSSNQQNRAIDRNAGDRDGD